MPKTDHQALAKAEEHRSRQQSLLKAKEFASTPWETLKDFPITPLCTLSAPVIVLPPEWFPAGILQALGKRSIDLSRILPTGRSPDEPSMRRAEETVRRMILAFWLFPRHTERGVRCPAPATFGQHMRYLTTMARWALERHPETDGTIFAHLTISELGEMVSTCGDPRITGSIVKALHQFLDRGLVTDFRALTDDATSNDRAERSHKGRPQAEKTAKEPKTWKPFPDAFGSEYGWRCFWIVEHLGPQLLDCYAKALAARVERKTPSICRDKGRAVIEKYPWTAPDGGALTRLPFDILLPCEDGISKKLAPLQQWPPRSFLGLRRMVSFLQVADYSVIALSKGARFSELASERKGCYEILDNGALHARVTSRTFKLEDRIAGRLRDWPIPPIAIRALQNQEILSDLLRIPGTDHIWVTMASGREDEPGGRPSGAALTTINVTFKEFVTALGIDHILGDGGAHSHRWRKTMARLAALAIVGAPKILMDLFGHRSIAMTLFYILADPAVAAEVEQVAKEQLVMLGKEAVENADKTGGTAAANLRGQAARIRRGDEAMGVRDVREAAEVLTLNGKSWRLVRGGVICTKGPSEMGLCTKARGIPDPARCRCKCDHRLELAAARADSQAAVRFAAEQIQSIRDTASVLEIEAWRGQIEHHLGRFPDLRAALLAEPAVVAALTD